MFTRIKKLLFKPVVSTEAVLNSREEIQRLQSTVDRYERIFRGARDYGFMDWNLETDQYYWSGGFWKSIGYTEEDVEKLTHSGKFMDFVHKDDQIILGKKIYDILHGVNHQRAICRIRKKNGGYIWTEARGAAVREYNGRVKYMSGLVFDITTLKQTEQALLQSEARYARTIESSNDGIWEWTAATDDYHFSNRCWEQLGYTQDDNFLDPKENKYTQWRARLHPDDIESFEDALRRHFHEDAPFDFEYRIKAKNGEWKWIRVRGQMAYDDKGNPLRMSGTNMDVTELKQAQQKVLLSKETAEKANKAKSEFLSSMSHELRTPLNAILGFAQLFELDSTLEESQLQNAREIKKAGQHLLALVGDVLDLAKIESGHANFDFRYVALAPILHEAINLVMPLAQDRKVTLEANINEIEREILLIDEIRFRQVVVNLLSNAIKYNHAEGCVKIFAQRSEDSIKILIEDTGLGIPEAYKKNVFEPFNRLGAENSTIEGSGVGLIITQQLVERMNGKLDFMSEEGAGSTFSVEFPRDRRHQPRPSEQTSQNLEPGTKIPELVFSKTRKILYVEDNHSNLRVMQQFLNRFAQLELAIAVNGHEGFAKLSNDDFDLVILDINLPDISGYELLKKIRKDISSNLPLVGLSANALAHDIDQAIEAGFDAYLTKPLNLGRLIETLNRLLETN